MTKPEFVKAAKNVAKYQCGINLPISEDNLISKDGCIFYFYYELASTFEDADDNEIECTNWYSVAQYEGDSYDQLIEIASGIDGRSGDHFLVNYKDWLVERKPNQRSL